MLGAHVLRAIGDDLDADWPPTADVASAIVIRNRSLSVCAGFQPRGWFGGHRGVRETRPGGAGTPNRGNYQLSLADGIALRASRLNHTPDCA